MQVSLPTKYLCILLPAILTLYLIPYSNQFSAVKHIIAENLYKYLLYLVQKQHNERKKYLPVMYLMLFGINLGEQNQYQSTKISTMSNLHFFLQI